MLESFLIFALVIGMALVVRQSKEALFRISPFGLCVTLLSIGCLVFGEIVAHIFPFTFDPDDDTSGPLGGIFCLDSMSTLAIGLEYGGLLLILSLPFLFLHIGVSQLSRNLRF